MEKKPTMTTPQTKLMVGKVCLVTGATAGIGRVTAAALAGKGAQVVIHGRNKTKAEETVGEIISETGNTRISYLLADFSHLDEVRRMADQFQEQHDHLHVLVNNAGAFFNRRKLSNDGVEMTFLVNHLAPFLLTNLLLDPLKKSAPSRIINISSEGHRQGVIDMDDLDSSKGYFGMKAYGRSKLANLLFTYELARRLEGSGATVNALHPGHIATDIWKTEFGFFGPFLKWLMSKVALTPQEGAENSIYLASSPEVEGISGKYFIKNEPASSSAASNDEDSARALWALSEKLIA